METFRDIVKKTGLRQTWIAAQMDVDKTLLNHWIAERRKMPRARIDDFCRVTNTEPSRVLEALSSSAL